MLQLMPNIQYNDHFVKRFTFVSCVKACFACTTLFHSRPKMLYTYGVYVCTLAPTKNDSDVIFCLHFLK